MNPAHRFLVTSYPLAYSLIVLPLTVARWLQFSNYKVPPAVTFFGDTMFCLSGAINVLLFLIIRPGLLLFPRPEELAEPEIKLAPQGTYWLRDFLRHSRIPTQFRADLGGAGWGLQKQPNTIPCQFTIG